ncbi:MAG: hypothetical protein M3Y59_03575 [Myxococcota bacterium]|nr:hypothetical protein [Myxococcota bacterium]
MRRLILATVALLALAAEAAPAKRAVTRRPAGGRPGWVTTTYITEKRAYLDRGSEDGLVVGQPVALRRNNRVVGTCAVEQVSPSSAVCAGAGLRPGDSAPLAGSPEGKGIEPGVPRRLPAPPSAAELERQRRRVLSVSLPRVESSGTQTPGARVALRSGVEAAHDTWASVSRGDTAYHRESVDLWVSGVSLPWGLRLFADATAQQWTGRPAGFLSPHRSASQLVVRELAVTRRDPADRWVFSAGRVWPYRAASLGVLDGAQVGFRSEDGSWELGAFGGATPSALNTAVDLSRPLVGAYGGFTWRGEAPLRWLQQEAHLAWQPGGGGSAEVLARAWLPPFLDVAADVEVAWTPAMQVALRAVRADLGYRPVERVWLRAASRFEGSPREVLPTVATLGPGIRALHLELSAGWDVWTHLQISASAGHARDLDSSLDRTWVGPELVVPGLAWGMLSLGGGYQEEVGWLGGRSAWVWASARPAPRTHLQLRGSWTMTGPALESGAWAEREWGLYASAAVALTPRWSLRGSALARIGQELGGQATVAVAARF